MKKSMYYFFAILACLLLDIIYITLGVLLFNWENGGGTLPMILLFGLMVVTWKFIVGLYKKPISENVIREDNDIVQESEFEEVYDKNKYTNKELETINQFKTKLKEGNVIVKDVSDGYIKIISKKDYTNWVKYYGNSTVVLLVKKEIKKRR